MGDNRIVLKNFYCRTLAGAAQGVHGKASWVGWLIGWLAFAGRTTHWAGRSAPP